MSVAGGSHVIQKSGSELSVRLMQLELLIPVMWSMSFHLCAFFGETVVLFGFVLGCFFVVSIEIFYVMNCH